MDADPNGSSNTMDTNRWQRIKELFHAASELEPEQRADFLDEACAADEELRAEVEGMLRAEAQSGEFIAPPSPETLVHLLHESEDGPQPGMRVGPYVLKRRIASGGMGTVFEGNRADDFEQTVAIKLVRPSANNAELLRRFHAERQTLARLDHPCIARLLDGGATEDGQPYFALEFVDGEALDQYCDSRRMDVSGRLRLFTQVCAAVQDAHKKLVVHRDIKPANILVDRSGRPKLLDFGIAKVLAQDTWEGLTATRLDARPMTPQYASPEQVRGEEITTATDVYSLGVLLYELLTGRRPYRTRTTLAHEVERAICEEEPERPSTALGRRAGQSNDLQATPVEALTWPSASELAARRSTDVATLRRRLAGDLDAIVLKAMRKEPELRYASAGQLADDVQRYLAGRPVQARKDTWRYRTMKFLRRHQLAAASTSIFTVLLIASGAGWIWSSTLAATRATNLLQLMHVADLIDLEEYVAEVDQLWPATPEMAGEMRTWLDKARTLGSQLDEYRASLAKLRANALPYSDADRRADRENHPRRVELERLLMRRAAEEFRVGQGGAQLEARQETLQKTVAEIEQLEGELNAQRTWRFLDERDQWQHDKLARLVARLDQFVASRDGLVATVEARLEFATSIVQKSLEEPRAAWAEAIAAIADAASSPLYAGLQLEPQLGLVPLGADPQSGLWEFGHLQTGELPVRGASGRLEIGEDTALVFVLVPGGRFNMGARRPTSPAEVGAPEVDAMAQPSELPVHEVELAPFFLSKFEMTQGQWLRFTGANPSQYLPGQVHGERPNDLSHPVESMSWFEAVEVLAHLGLTLPTEAQWEYAGRAGTTTPWTTGEDHSSLHGAANLADLTAAAANASWSSLLEFEPETEDGYIASAPVGHYSPNAYGLHDVHGNVWEWTSDDYANYELPVLPGNGERMYKGSDRRVGRGGSFSDSPRSARTAHRGAAEPDYRDQNLGLRPARAIEP